MTKWNRRFAVGSILMSTVLAMAVLPAQAAQPDPSAGTTLPAPSPKIVGGAPAAPGSWPSMVALVHSSNANNYQAQFCGGTVIDPSWILTAAHCIVNETPGSINVLVGTQSLTSGGVRLPVAELRAFPGYNATTFDGDYGLIRLATPTSAPLQAFTAQGVDPAPGTQATVTGWGDLAAGAGNYPTSLNQATVPIISNTTCAEAGYFSQITGQMICAGQSPYKSVDTCDGDSGGPLLVSQGGRWVEVGITSWGDGCAEGAPGVYTRISAQSNWIQAQIRFGPHSNATDFVLDSWQDLYAGPPSNLNLFYSVAAQNSMSPTAWLSQQIQGTGYQSTTGAITRLYRAFFLRDPDASGMNFWWGAINNGWTLWGVANYFAQSPEFISRYGSLTNTQYVDLLYQNVLGRAADPGGEAFWTQQLTSGAMNRGQVMVGFSESNENITNTKARTDVLITYWGLLHRLPTSTELSTWLP
ncbi:MAG: trypsin-like serine protease, partial [Actinobacteria bacterium]|nr:trypsin-like serine protease [Actinomycetota bacterium]